MKIIKNLKILAEAIKKCWEWACKSRRNAIIAAVISVVVIALVILLGIFLIWLLRILALIIVALLLFLGEEIVDLLHSLKHSTKLQDLDDDSVAGEVTTFMHNTVTDVGDVLSGYVGMPSTVYDMYDGSNFREKYCGANVLKLQLLKKPKDIQNDDLTYIKHALQGAVKSRIQGGYLYGHPWAISAAPDIPLIKIAYVKNTPVYINIGVLLVNNSISVNAARNADKPIVKPSVDSADPLFKRDGDKT